MQLTSVLFALLALVAVVAAQPPWQRANNPNFIAANKAQLDAISDSPLTDLWYQNISIYADDPQIGISLLANYGYWQSRIYNQNVGAFEEVQAWYRSETVLAFQQINSEPLRPEFTVSPDGGVERQDQSYRVYWTTNVTFDSASVLGLKKQSSALGSNVVRIAFTDPDTGVASFTEELMTVIPKLQRRYTNTFVVDSTGSTLPLTILFNSFVVPIEYQPEAVRAGFAAYRAGTIPKAEDPAAVNANIPFNLIYLYTHPETQARDVDDYYAGQPDITVNDVILVNSFK